MGAGIAQVTATAGYETVCYDVDADALDARRGARHDRALRVRARASSAASSTREDADAALRAPVVHRVVRRSRRRRPGRSRRCPRSSSSSSRCSATSTPPRPRARSWRRTRRASRSARSPSVTQRPELVIGWHWASPPAVMRLAEIVRGPAPATRPRRPIVELATACGKNPVVISDSPDGTWGFVANRVVHAR